MSKCYGHDTALYRIHICISTIPVFSDQGVEVSRGFSYSMANEDVQQYLSVEQDA
jgi:hypothetical protein